MSNWYWRVVALKAAFVLTCLVSYLRADDTIQKLPFCNPHTAGDASATDDLVIVSTLDGRLTAFAASNGIKAWDVQTQPLLSSNLHHVELTSGGKWVRLVPSLRGTLYSLSGDTVEPLPFDAEQLLSSSFKYSEDLVIAGARETTWLGLDANTGAVVYECGSGGCSGDQDGGGKTLLVLRRHSSTVRALDPKNGHEKWNFSVGEHQLALSARGGCGGGSGAGPAPPDYQVGLALPEGVVAVRQPDSQLVLWKQKLEAPVAGMWRLRAGSLQSIDVLWAATRSLTTDTFVQTVPPSLYIGLHDSQLYIQEGPLYIQKQDTAVSAKPVPWKLKHVRPLIAGPNTDVATSLQNSDPNTLSLITLYGNTRDENQGYFLYQEETCDQAVQVTEDLMDDPTTLPPVDDHSDHHHIHVHVYSLWFWWKEVLLIAISSALLMNLMIWPRFFATKASLLPVTPVRQYTNVYQVHYDQPPVVAQPEYSGRYENDFTPLRCLGRGGFGVVFEARNNIDHCSYAVKRITLPRRESKRERVLREVRALAKLEHEHIVRYFNAWLEEPPARWQQLRDEHWMRELDGVSVTMTEEGTSPRSSLMSPLPPPLSIRDKVEPLDAGPTAMLNFKPDLLDFEKELGPKRLRSLSCNDSLSIVFDSRASQHSDSKTKSSLKHSLDLASDLSIPPDLKLTKNLASGDNDDSFIVFERSEDVNHNTKGSTGQSEARNDSSYNKQLARVKEEEVTKTGEGKKKKKGHTRHWSLDMCVKSDTTNSQPPSKMYLYIQMQLCRRDSLHDWLRNNRTYEARAGKVKTLFSQIVSAVEYVHLAGLIHRDLKPSNIFFAPDGKVKVGDFGLVTAMGDCSQDGDDPPQELEVHTRHTYRVGTHLYMSPEQLSGGRYGYKVDIYSLGLVLFELLQPFGTEAERVESLLRARRANYPPAFCTDYPHEMEMLKQMLSEDPSKRPTASGVKAGAPLYEQTDERWHYNLPNTAAA